MYTLRMIEIIGAPFDLCGFQLGSRLGPAAIRLAGIDLALRALELEVLDSGDVPASNIPATIDDGLVNFSPLSQVIRELRETVVESLEQRRIPVVLGGEHTLVIGGIAAAIQHFPDDLALLWIDAHADINTPGSSETGNLHGMPLAALQGLESGTQGQKDLEWQSLLETLGPNRLASDRVAWLALRDVDRLESPLCKKGLPITMHEIDRQGIERTVHRLDDFFRQLGVRHLWISFDVDALDPILAPGTGTAVRGGLSYRESHLVAELLHEMLSADDCPYRLVGVDLVETNPLTDTNNQTAKMAVEWIASLFGKTILGT